MSGVRAIFGEIGKHLSMSGRGNTSDYVPYFITGATLIAASAFLSDRLKTSTGNAAPLFVDPFFVSIVVPILIVPAASRRVHDLGLPSIVVILPFCLPFGLLFGPMAWAWIEWIFDFDPTPERHGEAFVYVMAAMFMQAINLIIAVVLCFKSSQPGPNQYGPNPNEVSS